MEKETKEYWNKYDEKVKVIMEALKDLDVRLARNILDSVKVRVEQDSIVRVVCSEYH